MGKAARDVARPLVLLGAGLAVLGWTASHASLQLSWSDEIVYAVMGRNIAEGRGPITNFYDARALLRDGYPQGDVHMPGHALFMSVFFRLLGAFDRVAFVPSWVAFLATGMIVGTLATRLPGRSAGLVAALVFLAMPGVAGYAHTAMSELTVVLSSALVMLAWWDCRTPWRAALLAVSVAAAVLCRETGLAFAILGLEAIRRAAPGLRVRMAVAFTAAFALCAPVLASAWQARARFPHFLSSLPDVSAAGFWPAVLGRVRDNLAFSPKGLPEGVFAAQCALGILLPAVVLARSSRPELKRLAAVVLVLCVAALAGLAGFYPLKSWAAVRALLFLSPWIAVLLAGVLPAAGALRFAAAGVLIALLGGASSRVVAALAEDRRTEQARNAEVAGLFLRLTGDAPITSLVAQESPWEIGWRRYPITVVWNVPLEPEGLRRVSGVLPIDAVFGRTRPLLALAEAAERGELGEPYDLVHRNPSARRQLLLRRELRAQP